MLSKKPGAIVVENVPEFRKWGPGGDGRHYRRWLGFFQDEGYRISENVLDAADFGVAQHRVRLFVLMVHESVTTAPVVVPGQHLPRVAAASILDLDGYRYQPLARKSPITQAKVALQRDRLGLDEFLFAYNGKRGQGRPLSEPLGTITTRDRWAVVRGDRIRMLQIPEARRGMGFPEDYRLPVKPKKLAVHLLGNAVVPAVARHVIETACVALRGRRAGERRAT